MTLQPLATSCGESLASHLQICSFHLVAGQPLLFLRDPVASAEICASAYPHPAQIVMAPDPVGPSDLDHWLLADKWNQPTSRGEKSLGVCPDSIPWSGVSFSISEHQNHFPNIFICVLCMCTYMWMHVPCHVRGLPLSLSILLFEIASLFQPKAHCFG